MTTIPFLAIDYILDQEDPNHKKSSLNTWVDWSSDIGKGEPIGTGRNGYYYIGPPEIGWCNSDFCWESGTKQRGIEIFDFRLPILTPLRSPYPPKDIYFQIYTRGYRNEKSSYVCYEQIPFKVYINDNFIGEGISAKQKEEKIVRFRM